MSVNAMRDYVIGYDSVKAIDEQITLLKAQLTKLESQRSSEVTALKAMPAYTASLDTSEKSEMDVIAAK